MSTRGDHFTRRGHGSRGAALALPILAFGLLFASDAFAYLDPGTGSILLQGLVAATAAVVTWVSVSWRRTKAWLRIRNGQGARDGGDGGVGD